MRALQCLSSVLGYLWKGILKLSLLEHLDLGYHINCGCAALTTLTRTRDTRRVLRVSGSSMKSMWWASKVINKIHCPRNLISWWILTQFCHAKRLLLVVAHYMAISWLLDFLPLAPDFKLSITLGHPITFVVVQGSLAKNISNKFSIYILWSLVSPLPLWSSLTIYLFGLYLAFGCLAFWWTAFSIETYAVTSIEDSTVTNLTLIWF